MKRKQNNLWSRIKGDLIFSAIVLAFIGGFICYDNSQRLKESDFAKAPWIEYNSTGMLWSCYMDEAKGSFRPSVDAWSLYQEKVNERNPRGLIGNILLPDLNYDNKVGK